MPERVELKETRIEEVQGEAGCLIVTSLGELIQHSAVPREHAVKGRIDFDSSFKGDGLEQLMEVDQGLEILSDRQERFWLSEGSKGLQGTNVRVEDATLTSVVVKQPGKAAKSDTKPGKKQSAEEGIKAKPSKMLSPPNVNTMGMAEVEVSEPERRICLASINQNGLRNTSRITPSLSINRGEKWVRLQRDK